MADVTDDFGRVSNFDKADFESVADMLRTAVGKAVDYAAGKAKESSDATGKKFDELVKAMEDLGDNIKDSLKSTKDFVERVKKASESVEAKRGAGGGQKDSIAAAQREQTRILSLILKNQQRAMAEKAAKFTTGGTTLSSGSARRPALKEMGFRPRGADRVPAMLSPGEFVVSRRGARGNEGTLNRINRGYMRGGKVKPAYLEGGGGLWDTVKGLMRGKGGISYDAYEGKTRVLLDPGTDPETIEKIKKAFAEAGVEASTEFADNYRKNLGRTISGWTGGIAEQLIGHNPLQTLFEGGVKDITEFRREMRNLAFQTEGITGDFREAQAEFAKIGTNITARTGKGVTAFQKAYMNNARKGFKDQKAGMKVLESGLELSTMIGSETQATATLFADWHRELGLSSIQMEKISRDMKTVAMNTGVTGDELLNAMKSSDGILKNLRNQGNLTSNVAKNVVTMMAEAQKTGYGDSTNKYLTALSSYSGMNSADKTTQALLFSVGNRMGGDASRQMLTGNFMKSRENLGRFSTELKDLVANQIGKKGSEFDFSKITDEERTLLAMRLQALGIEIGEAENLIKTSEKASKGLAGTLEDLDKVSNSKFATDEEKKVAEKKMNDALLASSMDFLSGIRDKTGEQSLGDAMKELEGRQEFGDQRKDFAAMASALTPSMMSQFGLSSNKDQASKQMAAMDIQKQAQLSSLIAADQLMKAAKAQGTSVKNFGPEMQAALARGDTKRFNELRDEMQGEMSKIGVSQAKNVDPMEKLNFTMTKLNETLRGWLSPLVGGIIDLVGSTGLLAIAFGMMSGNLFNLISPKFIQGIFGGGLGTKLLDGFDKFAGNAAKGSKDGMFKRFFQTYTSQRKGGTPGMMDVAEYRKFRRSGMSPIDAKKAVQKAGGWQNKGVFESLGKSFKDLGDDIARNLNGLGKATSRFFSKFVSGFKFGFKSSGNFFTAVRKGFTRAMKSSGFTRGILTKMGDALKMVNGKYIQTLASIRKTSPALASFLRNSVNMGKSFMKLKFGESFVHFGRAMRSGFSVFRSAMGAGFSAVRNVFNPRAWSKIFTGAKGLLGAAKFTPLQMVFSAIDGIFGAVSGFTNTGKNFEGVMKAMGKSTKDMTWGMYASSTTAGALVGILDGLTFGLLRMSGVATWLEQTLSLVFYTIFSVVEGMVEGVMEAFKMVWSAFSYIGTQFKDIGDSLLGVFNSIAGIFGASAGNWSEAFAKMYPWLKAIGKVIGFIVGMPIMATLWLLVKGISLALVPIQMLINAFAGVIKIISGFVKFFTDIFSVGLWQATKNLFGVIGNAIYGVFKPIVDFFGSLVKDIYAPFEWLGKILCWNSIVPDMCTAIAGFFGKMALNVIKFVAGIPGRVAKGLFNVFFKAPVKIFGKIFKHLNTKTIKSGLGLVAEKFSGFFGLFRNNITGFTKFFATSWFDFVNKASGGLFGKVINAVKNSKIAALVDDFLIKPIAKGLEWLGGKAGEVFSWLGKRAGEAFSWIGKRTKEFLGPAVNWIRGQVNKLVPGAKAGVETAKKVAEKVAEKTGIKTAVEASKNFVSKAANTAKEVVKKGAGKVAEMAPKATGALRAGASKATEFAKGVGAKFAGKGASSAAGAADDIAKAAPKALGFLGKSSQLMGSLAKKLPVVGPLLDFGIRKATGQSTAKAVAGTAGGALGGIAGGAALGTLVGGPIGTLIGGIIGGVTGGMATDWLYDKMFGDGSKPSADKAAQAATAASATPVGGHAVPTVKSEGTPAAEAQPVHLRDITGSILRDKAGAGGNKLQSDELARMESASQKQVSELEQIRQGIQELVSLMKPSGSNIATGLGDVATGKTRDPRRPMHAARFGKMKYGKIGGMANRSLVNNGEV